MALRGCTVPGLKVHLHRHKCPVFAKNWPISLGGGRGVPPPHVKNGICKMWGNTVGQYLIARNSKTYRNFSTTQTILDTPDKSLYTDNNKTTVSFKERKWWNFQKKTIWYNFMKTKIWYFHPFSRQFIVRPMGQWANLMPTSCPRCSGLSRMCSFNFLLRLDKKQCNYAWAMSKIPINSH